MLDDYLLGIEQLEARLTELDARLTKIADTALYREPVAWLRCFRDMETLTAMPILAELYDFRWFPLPRALMAYLRLVPGEDSTGEKHRRGRITRTGSTLVRRLLVETACRSALRASKAIAPMAPKAPLTRGVSRAPTAGLRAPSAPKGATEQ